MIALEAQSLAQLFTASMLNSAVEGLLLAAVIWLLLRLIRRQNSGTRFAIWMAALVAVVSLPFFAASGRSLGQAAPLGLAQLHTAILLPRTWALVFFAVWAAIAALLLLRLAAGLWTLRRLRAGCTEVDPATLDPAILATLQASGMRAPLRLCLSDEIASPAVMGFLHPAIVFPATLFPQLSAPELEIILLHEIAHLRRGDQWSNLVQKLLKALFFFHPAVWWIESQLTLEREMACDDLVLTHRTSPRDYATVLIVLAEKLHSAPALALTQALLSRMHQMSRRIAQILDARRPGGSALAKPVLGGGVLLLVLALGTAPYVPRLIAFRAPAAARAAIPEATSEPGATAIAAAKDASTAQAELGRPKPLRALWHASKPSAAQLADLRENNPQANDSPLAQPYPAHPAPAPTVAASQEAAAEDAPVAMQAGFHPRAAAVRVRAAQNPQPEPSLAANPAPAQASTSPSSSPATYVIVQTTMVDASGSHIWTLCVWRVEGGGAARQLESAIALAI